MKTAKFNPGDALDNAAWVVGMIGVVFPPLLVVGFILAACAMEKSVGKTGANSRRWCLMVLSVWLLAVFVIYAIRTVLWLSGSGVVNA